MVGSHPRRKAVLLVVPGHVKFILLDDVLNRSPLFHLVLMLTLNKKE